jgi:predicted nucleic acid-binding protein
VLCGSGVAEIAVPRRHHEARVFDRDGRCEVDRVVAAQRVLLCELSGSSRKRSVEADQVQLLTKLIDASHGAPHLHTGLREPPVASMPVEYAAPASEDRAVGVLGLLADRGHHRTPSVPDLLIAAIAERAGLVVLHHDKDFDLIAQITGQPTERLNG